MDIIFAGICCWVDSRPPREGKTVIIMNATRGGAHHGLPIPAHTAFVHAKQGHVDDSEWPADMVSADNLVFELQGDVITFDPMPGGGKIDIADLPHVKTRATKEPICAAADVIRSGFLDEPSAEDVLGLVHLPEDAPVSTSANGFGAVFATLHMPATPVTITATPFDGSAPRVLRITDPAAHVFIANVTLMDYLKGTRADEDNHRYLICEMFRPHTLADSIPLPPNATGTGLGAEVRTTLSGQAPLPFDRQAHAAVKVAHGKPMHDFLSTFAAGCSDSQWP